MRIIMKIGLSAIWLSMSLGAIAAQAPVQEPISELQWQQAGRAFMSGLYPHAGVGSIVNQLPPYVAKDIVELAKPKEYGFIKNFADKNIVFFGLKDHAEHFFYMNIIFPDKFWGSKNYLEPHYQFQFIDISTEQEMPYCGRYCINADAPYRYAWISGIPSRLFDVSIRLEGESMMEAESVDFSDLMNVAVYEEDQHIRLEVTAPYHKPLSYYPEYLKKEQM